MGISKIALSAGIAAVAMVVAAPAHAEQRSFDVPAMPAQMAIYAFARQANVDVLAPSSILRGARTNPVRGTIEVGEALKRLLVGTGLQAEQSAPGKYLVRPVARPARAPRETHVAAPPAPPAPSEAAPGRGQLDEIIVTANKREESIQTVPTSITAFDRKALSRYGIESGEKLAQMTPNFVNNTLFGPGSPPFMSIRGVNYLDFNFVNEMPVGTYMDEVYMGSQDAIVGQVFDQERVEVLKGPQGTLFGRNTTAGAVHFIAQKPTKVLGGYARLQYGSYNQVIAEGALNLPVGDRFRVRLAGKYNRDDGVRVNRLIPESRFGKTDIVALRGIAQLDLTDNLELEASIHYTDNNSTFSGLWGLGKIDPATGLICQREAIIAGTCATFNGYRHGTPDPRRIDSDVREYPNTITSVGGYGKLTWHMGDITVTSITGVEHSKGYIAEDVDGRNAPFNIAFAASRRHRQFSEELRVSGDTGPVKWVVGGYYYDDEKASVSDILINGFAVPTQHSDKTVKTRSSAVFGQLDWALNDKVTLVGGLRYTDERRRLTRFVNGLIGSDISGLIPNSRAKAVTGTAAIEYHPNSDVMLFAKYSSGYKSGGFNTANTITMSTLSLVGPDRPEKVSSYEAGIRSEWLDRRLRANVTGFYMDYKGIQAFSTSLDPNNPTVFNQSFINLDKSRIYGAEIELQFSPNKSWDFLWSTGLLNTRITDSTGAFKRSQAPGTSASGPLNVTYFANGSHLPNAPAFNTFGSIQYHYDAGSAGVFTLQAEGHYQSSIFFYVENDPLEYQGGYAVFNLRGRWQSANSRYSAEVFVENVANKAYATHAFDSASDFSFRTPGLPRLFGVKLGVNF